MKRASQLPKGSLTNMRDDEKEILESLGRRSSLSRGRLNSSATQSSSSSKPSLPASKTTSSKVKTGTRKGTGMFKKPVDVESSPLTGNEDIELEPVRHNSDSRVRVEPPAPVLVRRPSYQEMVFETTSPPHGAFSDA